MGAKIILGVTGGIAAYKSCELVRLLKKAGHEVRVIMSHNAKDFVGPLTFASLSGNAVLGNLGDSSYDLSATAHIDLAQWGELFVVAPATANFLAKYAHGICDEALLTEALVFQGPVLIAPAMNTRMWEAPITQQNLAKLKERGVKFVGPISGDLACGETGLGKMSEPAQIFEYAQQMLGSQQTLKGIRVLVTSGPTRSYLDPVRFLSNRSSGRMGWALADRAAAMGATVTLVTGPVEERFATLRNGELLRVETAEEMYEQAARRLSQVDIVIAAAAVADFVPSQVSADKIRREGDLTLSLKSSRDVIGSLAESKTPKQVFVGFAAELGSGAEVERKALDKLERKNLDLLVLNDVSRTDIGFDAEDNEATLYTKTKSGVKKENLAKSSKAKIASLLIEHAARYWKDL